MKRERLSGQHLISLSRQPTTKSNISLNPIPITIMWTSLQRSTDRLYCRVLPTSTVTTCSFNPVVTIITMFPSNVSSIGLPEKMQSRNGCTYLTFLYCVFLNVSSNCLYEHMHSYIGCIISLFSTVRFQMCPQIACTRGCKVTLIALFFTVCY